MTHRQFRQKRRELIEQAISDYPDIASGRLFIIVVTLIWTITRVIQILSELLSELLGSLIYYSFHNVLMLLVIAIYLAALYMGLRWTVIFPVFTGSILVFETFKYGLYDVLTSSDYFFDAHLYAFTYIVAAYGQILCSIMLAVNKRANSYFNTIRKITHDLELEDLQEKYEQKKKKKK